MESLRLLAVIVGLCAVCLGAGCRTASERPTMTSTMPPTIRVPASVERLGVLYPSTNDRLEAAVYRQLEGGTFQLKTLRPTLRLVERADLAAILTEQQRQLDGTVSEETAIGVGRLLGVDSVLLYRVETPTFRDRAHALFDGVLPPLVISSKIIAVESGEVVFENVVTTVLAPGGRDGSPGALDARLTAALERAVQQTLADLRHAFE